MIEKIKLTEVNGVSVAFAKLDRSARSTMVVVGCFLLACRGYRMVNRRGRNKLVQL